MKASEALEKQNFPNLFGSNLLSGFDTQGVGVAIFSEQASAWQVFWPGGLQNLSHEDK